MLWNKKINLLDSSEIIKKEKVPGTVMIFGEWEFRAVVFAPLRWGLELCRRWLQHQVKVY